MTGPTQVRGIMIDPIPVREIMNNPNATTTRLKFIDRNLGHRATTIIPVIRGQAITVTTINRENRTTKFLLSLPMSACRVPHLQAFPLNRTLARNRARLILVLGGLKPAKARV
jgi:hypothetical protein